MNHPKQTPESDPRGGQFPADIEQLGDRIAELSAQIQAATFRLLTMIREFDERAGWNCGFRSCAHWLSWRAGYDLGAARAKVRVARALGHLPAIGGAMRRGQLSYSKVRALTRVATPENEEELLAFATAGTAAHVEKLVRAWRRVDRIAERRQEERRRASRYLQAYTDEDGMVVVRGRLEPETGAALLRALDAASEVLFERSRKEPDPNRVPVEQRRADAIGLVAEAALENDLDKGTRGDRYQVVVHVDAEVLEDPDQPGVSALEDGQNVSAETSRRLACDAGKVVMQHARDGTILDMGRRRRTIPPALRRALVHRDGGCVFPGCGVRHCDGHHLEHWADGGETKLENLILLCRFHHRAVHEEGFRVERLPDGGISFSRPDGRPIPEAPPLRALAADPVARLVARLADDGIDIDASTSLPTWEGGAVDYGWAIDWFCNRPDRASEPRDVSAETSRLAPSSASLASSEPG
jgi:hypothetical protein